MKDMPFVTTDNLKQFKVGFFNAIKNGKKSFMFEGQEVLVSYAKYLIEYFQSQKL